MRNIILIGGAPATGKTTLAKFFSKKLNVPWISTDLIRSWMKSIVSKDDFPDLFNFVNITAEEHYTKFDVLETINYEVARDKEVFKGVKSFIDSNDEWVSFIIEGISIHPDFVSQLSDDFNIIPVFLIDENSARIKDIIYSRGLWDKAGAYSDWVKEIEIDYLIQTNTNYLESCKKNNLKFFLIDKDRNKTINEIASYLDTLL